MRQIGGENEDPLKRIQEEINEVAQRERELRTQIIKRSSPKDAANEDALSTTHSDDSGFSTSPSPVNGVSAEETKPNNLTFVPTRTIGFNVPRQANILTRTVSTPQIYAPAPVRRFNGPAAQKGIMQKFIASRGKLNANGQTGNVNKQSPISIELNTSSLNSAFVSPTSTAPAQIERDEEGRPIRRGYIPVNEKIRRELREMKNREQELKKLRKEVKTKRNQSSNPDLLNMNDEDYGSEDDVDDNYNFDYPPPGKLRQSKSISELCDALGNSSLSPRNTPSPNLDQRPNGIGGLRPAISLAKLCDLEPEEAPSSHRLIAQWDNIIQKSQEVV